MCCSIFNDQRVIEKRIVSVLNAEGPPVPIPNTEVKLCSGENTLRVTVREDSPMLTSAKRGAKAPPKVEKEVERNYEPFEKNKWGCSSAGRAPALQAGGHGFESHHLHQRAKRAIEN